MNWQYLGQLRGNQLPKEEPAPSVSYGAIFSTEEWLKQRNAKDFYRNSCNKLFLIYTLAENLSYTQNKIEIISKMQVLRS
jgi:hypothetical protein